VNKRALATIQQICRAEITRQINETVIKPEAVLPAGYKPLAEIRRAMIQWVYTPFADAYVWLELRSLNANQIEACGNISLIEVIARKRENTSRTEMIELRNTQENLAKAVMNNPTFAEFEKIIYGEDRVITERRERIAGLRRRIDEAPREEKPALEREFSAELDALELFTGYILPENTIMFLTQWALGLDVSEIKTLTKDRLLDAARLAKAGGDNPHDHLSGIFTDRDREEIDKAAWYLWFEWMGKPGDKRGK
jgi:hypothetical protein